jgi:hypothetical protein
MKSPTVDSAKSRGVLALMVVGGFLIVLIILSTMESWMAWPPVAKCGTEACKEGREWISAGVTLLVVLGGLYQYQKAQLWKRSEFVAAEMKAFFSDPEVRKATTMIDWAVRRINLFNTPDPDQSKWPVVSREMQCRALLPHSVIPDKTESEAAADFGNISGSPRLFTLQEAAIRDSYDRLLDGLERFASYIETRLVTRKDLEPYLGYWIRDIASTGEDEIEVRWTFLLFVYIDFYRFAGVQKLFRLNGVDVAFGSRRFDQTRAQMTDQGLVALLDDALKKRHEQSDLS